MDAAIKDVGAIISFVEDLQRYRDVAGRGVRHPRSPVSWTCSCCQLHGRARPPDSRSETMGGDAWQTEMSVRTTERCQP